MGNPNWTRVGVDGTAALLKLAVRSGFRMRTATPLESLVDLAAGATKSALGVREHRDVPDGEYDYEPVDEETAAEYWDQVGNRPYGVILVIGGIGGGKSSACAFIAEMIQERQNKPSLWLGPDQRILDTLGLAATAISLAALTKRISVDDYRGDITDTVIVIEDSVRTYSAYSTMTKETQALQAWLGTGIRKNNNVCLINSQSAAIISKHILPTSVLCKRPHLNYKDEERGGQLARSRRAERALNLLGSEREEHRMIWVEDPLMRFMGLVPIPKASGWSEAFSKAG